MKWGAGADDTAESECQETEQLTAASGGHAERVHGE